MARLDFTASNILTAAEMDELARQAISNVTNAGKPSGTAEGETVAVTDKDRLEHWNGSAWIRGAPWAAAGRTWVTKTEDGPTTLTSGVAQFISWQGGTDADSFYTGWNGSTGFDFTVPSGLDGVYMVTVRFALSAGWTPNVSDVVRVLVSGAAFDFPQQPIAGVYIASFMWPLVATETVSVTLAQYSGSGKDIDAGVFTMVRLSA